VHGTGYYELLGVDRDASTTEIKSAYRTRARSMHPDAGGSPTAFHQLREAYETLSDPALRADYDRGAGSVELVPAPTRRATRPRNFGEDPAFTADTPRLDPESLAWWAHVAERAHPDPAAAPGHAPVTIFLGWLLLIAMPIMSDTLLLTGWVLLTIGVAIWLARQYLAMARARQEFEAEFGETVVFGRPGGEPDQWGERLTAELLERYLTRLPGARVFHGLSWPDSVFADIDHAVLAGRRLVLIESKTWLPGHYAADETGTLWRNDQRFRGGATRLPEAIEAYRELLPGVEIRGALIVYPSRAGEVSTDEDLEAPAPPMTPEQFVHEIGGWLAAESSTVDIATLRIVRDNIA
jgi:DnaJ domain/Nuclease-related domain